MSSLQDFGKVWMASSPLTDNFPSIKNAIEAGADTIVLKSVTSIAKPGPKKGKRTIKKGHIMGVDQNYTIPDIDIEHLEKTGEQRTRETLYCTSTDKEIEMLSFEEANIFYHIIKKFAPEIKVVQNFAPTCLNDFKLAEWLRADAIEFNSRWYDLGVSKPYAVGIWSGRNMGPWVGCNTDAPEGPEMSERVREEYEKLKAFDKGRRSKIQEFGEGLSKLSLKIPVLFKFPREIIEFPLEEALALEVDGFTYADSQKSSSYQSIDSYAMLRWGKGSICGEWLKDNTLPMLKHLRDWRPDTYFSASGGIMNADVANECLEHANSVQICSAVYFQDGWERLSAIVEGVRAPVSGH